MKEKNRTWGKWYLKGLAFLATGIFTSMAAGLSVMAQTELTFTEKLTIEEVRELSEPEKEYEDENGIRYELKHWELQEKEGEEIKDAPRGKEKKKKKNKKQKKKKKKRKKKKKKKIKKKK